MQNQDPRIAATRQEACRAVIDIVRDSGIRDVTHQSVSTRTGISRSTLYRHWPDISALLLEAFENIARPPSPDMVSSGSFQRDLEQLLLGLIDALDSTEWGYVVPQLIASAAVDPAAKELLTRFTAQRLEVAELIVSAARARGELPADAEAQTILILAVAPVYYRRLLAGLPLGPDWAKAHASTLCRLCRPAEPPCE